MKFKKETSSKSAESNLPSKKSVYLTKWKSMTKQRKRRATAPTPYSLIPTKKTLRSSSKCPQPW